MRSKLKKLSGELGKNKRKKGKYNGMKRIIINLVFELVLITYIQPDGSSSSAAEQFKKILLYKMNSRRK